MLHSGVPTQPVPLHTVNVSPGARLVPTGIKMTSPSSSADSPSRDVRQSALPSLRSSTCSFLPALSMVAITPGQRGRSTRRAGATGLRAPGPRTGQEEHQVIAAIDGTASPFSIRSAFSSVPSGQVDEGEQAVRTGRGAGSRTPGTPARRPPSAPRARALRSNSGSFRSGVSMPMSRTVSSMRMPYGRVGDRDLEGVAVDVARHRRRGHRLRRRQSTRPGDRARRRSARHS